MRLRLRADVPLGVFLSGGIDSSAIVALASQELGGGGQDLLGRFRPGRLRRARATPAWWRERYRTDHHELIVEDRDMSLLDDLAYHLDEPFADPSALPTFMVCREARKHVTVCLSGDGGDELFAGYRRYRQALQLRALRLVPAGFGRVEHAGADPAPPRGWGRGFLERFGRRRGALPRAAVRVHARRASGAARRTTGRTSSPMARGASRPASTDRTATSSPRLQLVDQRNYLPDDILVKVDRTSMQTSLEVRVPFLDHLLVEFANAAPTAAQAARTAAESTFFARCSSRTCPRRSWTAPKDGLRRPHQALVSRLDAGVRARAAALRTPVRCSTCPAPRSSAPSSSTAAACETSAGRSGCSSCSSTGAGATPSDGPMRVLLTYLGTVGLVAYAWRDWFPAACAWS